MDKIQTFNLVTIEEDWKAFEEMRERCKQKPEMTLEEINNEIAEVRKNRHDKKI